MKVRGIVVVHLKEFIIERFGEGMYNEWLETLDQGTRDIYRNIILIDDWFPMRKALGQPLKKMCELFYDGNPIGARYSGRFAAIFVLKSRFKHLLVHEPADFDLKNFKDIFMESFSTAHVELFDLDSQNPVIRIHQFSNMDEFIENRLAGWIEKGLEFNSYYYNIVEITNSIARGDPYTEFVVHMNVMDDKSRL